jgi:hypothetical protein
MDVSDLLAITLKKEKKYQTEILPDREMLF